MAKTTKLGELEIVIQSLSDLKVSLEKMETNRKALLDILLKIPSAVPLNYENATQEHIQEAIQLLYRTVGISEIPTDDADRRGYQ